MLKALAATSIAALLTGCGEPTPTYKFIPLNNVRGLNDCNLIEMQTDGVKVFIIRCPNSEVNTVWQLPKGQTVMTSTSDGA